MGLEHLKKSPRKIDPPAAPKPPLVLDRTNEMLAPPDPAYGASAPGMPTGPVRHMTTGASVPPTPVPPPEVKSVTYRCSHTELIARFKSGDCPECRAKRRREKAAAAREKRDAKRADASQQFRFPPGSTFGPVTWDGERWCATLSVPRADGTVRQFHETGTGVEKVLRALKERYLESAP